VVKRILDRVNILGGKLDEQLEGSRRPAGAAEPGFGAGRDQAVGQLLRSTA
jgi:hypothetical protein